MTAALRERPPAPVPIPRPQVLITGPGLDGYDHAVEVIARALLDAGHEVICTAMPRTAEPAPATAPANRPMVSLALLPALCPRLTPGAVATTNPHAQHRTSGGRVQAAVTTVRMPAANALHAHLVSTTDAQVTGVVETLNRLGVGISGMPEQSC